MKVDAFDFDLPESCIALRPVSPRDSAKMLQVKDGDITDHTVSDLPKLLRAGDVLVLNETRVMRAALTGIRPARAHGGGGDVSLTINLHKQLSGNQWRAFIRPAKRLKDCDIITISERLSATVTDKQDGGDIGLVFNLSGPALSAEIENCGQPPLPPYIAKKRGADARDVEDYQTIFAQDTGSVAAPTAGLHFTETLFAALKAQGVQVEKLTLHVGAGTFLPVKAEDTAEHDMHSEWYSIDASTAERINAAKSEGRRIVAVGTTALRALESASKDGRIELLCADTDIFITPGYRFQMVDGLMTNFHLPRSTLFMLVSALAGLGMMQAAYAHAINSDYRFYSYGDSSLLWSVL